MSLFGNRRRKILLGVAALGFLLAAFVGGLRMRDGDRDDSVQIQLQCLTTNAANDVIASFSVTNMGTEEVTLECLISDIKTNGQWAFFGYGGFHQRILTPGQSAGAFAFAPEDMRNWRVRWIWIKEPTKLQKWKYHLRLKASSVIPGLRPDQEKFWTLPYRTNYSREYLR